MRFFKTMIGSFYSPEMYQNLRERRGHGLAYSFFLVLLTTLGMLVFIAPTLNQVHKEVFVGVDGRMPVFDDLMRQVAAQTPVMTYKNYKLQTREPGAHVIYLSAEVMGEHAEGAAITIDTSGKTTYDKMETPVLVGADAVAIQKSDGEIRIHPYKEIGSGDVAYEEIIFTPEKSRELAENFTAAVHEYIGTFYAFLGITLFLIFVAVMYVLRIFMMLALALGGLLVANILRTKISYESAMRLAAVSYTPVAILELVIPQALGTGSANVGWLFLCGIIMLTAGLMASRDA